MSSKQRRLIMNRSSRPRVEVLDERMLMDATAAFAIFPPPAPAGTSLSSVTDLVVDPFNRSQGPFFEFRPERLVPVVEGSAINIATGGITGLGADSAEPASTIRPDDEWKYVVLRRTNVADVQQPG